MSWPQIAMAVVSYVAQSSAQADQRKRQDNLAAQMNTYQQSKAAESTNAIKNFTNTLTPEQRQQQFEKEQSGIRTNLDSSVQANQSFQAPTESFGKTTADFTTRTAANDATTAGRLKTLLNSLAIMGAPGQRNLTSNVDLHTAAGIVDGANGAANRVGQYYKKAIGEQQPDAGLSLIGGVLSGAARGGVGNAATTGFTTVGGTSPIPGSMSSAEKLAKLLQSTPSVMQ